MLQVTEILVKRTLHLLGIMDNQGKHAAKYSVHMGIQFQIIFQKFVCL